MAIKNEMERCLEQVDSLELAHLVTAEMASAAPLTITFDPAVAWCLALFLQEAIAAHGNADAASNPTLYRAVLLLQDLSQYLVADRPAMAESLERSWASVAAEYEEVTGDPQEIVAAHAALGDECSPGGIIVP